MFNPTSFVGTLFRTGHAALICWGFALPVCAQQASPPAKAASDPTAIERSQRQSDNVYRWIRYFAEQPKKPEASKPRPKADAPAPAKKPEPKGAVADATDGVATPPPEATSPTSVSEEMRPALPVNTPPATTSAAPPAVVEPEVIAVAPPPLVPVVVVEPTIPRELNSESVNTVVRLSFTVQTDGTVTAPSILSGINRRLNRSALEAIAQWRFEPIPSQRVAQIEFQFNQR